MITTERLKHLLEYDPDTGIFRWIKSNSNRACAGSIAGPKPHKSGYCYIHIDGKSYASHRLVFLYMIGRFPIYDVDHKNRDRSDNRWINLREATRQQNMRNRIGKPNSKSSIKAVHQLPGGTWQARIVINRKTINLGCFECVEMAKIAYAEAAKRYFGEFARYTQ